MTSIQRVAVIGAGVLGSQIMMQSAHHGKTVMGHDVAQGMLDRLPERWEWMRRGYRADLPDHREEHFDEAIARIHTTTDLAEAVADADLVIEAITENLQIKRQVWAEIGAAAPAHAILATNTSSLRLSDFADATGHPDRFLALHFANRIWRHNTGEVMGTPATDPRIFNLTLEFAAEIGLVPIPVHKEVPGYILNSLLIPWLDAAAHLLVDGVGTPKDIDEVWKVATDAPFGPFEVFDVVGFNVAMNVSRGMVDRPKSQQFADLLEAHIKEGRSGLATGEGFYLYDAEGHRDEMSPRWALPNPSA